MPDEDQDNGHPEGAATPMPPGYRRRRLAIPVIAAAVALVIGAAGGASAVKMMRPTPEMAPLTPVAISAMPASSLITIKGKVAEIYGNKFVLQDESGKALVETGRAGEGGALVTRDEAVTVQGRFDDGFVHASYLVRQDGRTEALRPPKGPPHRRFADFDHRP
ncbi:hypothetical protein ACU8V1_13045 [Rhizobium leguminosarum]|jgi:uncharacterized protein YdeI (BOF family)|uniref:Bacterial OB-fold domain-containing protein n=1 Tax=Rhizobium leguminosarum TaxID=384 RepID=A0A6P0DC10_RHILE|nr:hypothetical protein [Rhizobium leguminosarum]ASS56738.1 hypothetical protein CHR56_20480 [Rhizobium leguminosarum bv. viciae]AVC50474.1 hypothetical protein RLV_5333 [Rhizobium leguminosarum bv. viciae]MBA9030092.1 uncharacterized protein YdeI (BOF family) [Rhizobium leguminosarum]MBB4326243.1 uncharacterized protein YdeI (BOF family) [Rhizobium leguminosarum]MBB4339397.1 uncharacterized protein YdeI (BOF family) [Rhizobium leguminosarum]